MIDQLLAICEQAMRMAISPDGDLIDKGLNGNCALKIIKAFWIDTAIELHVNKRNGFPSPAIGRA